MLLCLAGCDGAQKPTPAKWHPPPVKIQLGTSVDGLLKQLFFPFTSDCLKAVNLCWYELTFVDKKPLDVTITQPGQSLVLRQVIGLQVLANREVSQNVDDLDITLRGLPDGSSHKANRQWVYALLGDFKAAGWKKYYFPSDPRIAGSQLDKFEWKDNVFGQQTLTHPLFDPDVKMSLERWMAVNGFYDWYLYSGRYIAHVRVWRLGVANESSRPGSYLTSIEFSSLETFWRTDFPEADRPNWKALFADHLRQLSARRQATEAKARAAGVAVDEGYEGPAGERVQ
ncbi:hypothetical protein [Pseudomonas purpurea]|uniref:hypothetical protein n=1 Tax=Pseudomonas purpurea TaxID=3136737 RepID=UPI0032631933